MTSDFYVEMTGGTVVLSVKPSSELNKPRVLEKLEIERRYWSARGVKWELVTEREINRTKARNIEWLSQASDLSRFGLCEAQQILCIDFFMPRYISAPENAQALFRELEQRLSLSCGLGLNIYKHLAFHKRINVDVSQPIDVAVADISVKLPA
jgi:hypothetical protein